MKTISTIVAALCVLLIAPSLFAFCGFYVGGAGKNLYNDATTVVMMRDGTRTVLSMQNDYAGPPEDFALVIPVPQILKEENVKTLQKNIFTRVDALASPRLVEYWEQNPCPVIRPMRKHKMSKKSSPKRPRPQAEMSADRAPPKVVVEAEFSVAEYDIVVLSATEATALEKWLTTNKYKIPKNAAKYFQPYIQSGQYFFVAKVDVKKIKMAGGRATLSPLRFHYDSETFSLPIRLGLINSRGKQDLIVHILAKDRFEVANYPNTRIPTNLEVKKKTKKDFGSFYATLFDQASARNENAVVTEYAWAANTCDPCPNNAVGGGALNGNDISTLGGDVIAVDTRRGKQAFGWVLTRLHARYGKKGVGADLIFKKAEPIIGGREGNGDGRYAKKAKFNQFQARYIIRNRWQGKIACKNPRRGIWGGPPNGNYGGAKPAPKTAYVKKRNAQIASYVRGKIPFLKAQPIK